MALLRCTAIPSGGFHAIPPHASTVLVHAAEVILPARAPLSGGPSVPTDGCDVILLDATPVLVQLAEIVLSEGVSLLSGHAVPTDGRGVVLPRASSTLVHRAEIGLREGVSLLGRTVKPADSFGIVRRYQRTASASSCCTPRPVWYIQPRLFCARGCPCSAARRYQRTAPASSCTIPRPLAYMTPRLLCARGYPCSAARRYQRTASGRPAPPRDLSSICSQGQPARGQSLVRPLAGTKTRQRHSPALRRGRARTARRAPSAPRRLRPRPSRGAQRCAGQRCQSPLNRVVEDQPMPGPLEPPRSP